ncbi:hypothetical protein WME99_45035 [Sorangium sp. So ce136]|uniref:hypothetical protein n=1 Tax=Sorangium sp. So ce136 TaxID=3133284 RepID=UPI003F003AFC
MRRPARAVAHGSIYGSTPKQLGGFNVDDFRIVAFEPPTTPPTPPPPSVDPPAEEPPPAADPLPPAASAR